VTDSRWLIGGLLIVESLYFIFARLLQSRLPPAAAATYMMLVGAVVIALLVRGRIDWRVLRRRGWFFVTVGALVGVNTNLGFVAVSLVDPGTASLLSRTSILFGIGLGLVWLRERLTRLETVGALVAIAGVVVISAQPGEYLRSGAVIVIAATFLYALHSAIVKRFGGDIPFAEFMFFRVGSTTAVLALLTLAQGAFAWPDAATWGWLVAAGTVNVVVSRGLYYLALRRLDMSLLTIILTLTPVLTWLFSIAFFGGRPTAQEMAGGIATLAGVLVVTASRAGVLRA
jgi:O-acetylserine/cysteine efflux transporter